MPSELDRKYDAVLAMVTGPDGKIQIGRDDNGRAIVSNLPATLPIFFDVFCALHAGVEGLVCGDERLTFGQLHGHAAGAAKALAGGWGIAKGDRVAIAMRNAPAWIAAYMAVQKAGGVAVLVNGWWQPDELKHGIELTAPKLIIADAPRAQRIADAGITCETVVLPVEKHLDEALAPILSRGAPAENLPDVSPDDDATILFTSGSTGVAKGAVSTHRQVTTGVYAYAMGLATLLGIKESMGDPPKNPPRTLVNVPLFHVTGEVPVMLNSFVIGRGMVLMARWDAGEALRLIEKEKITYFVGVPTMSLELMQHPDHATRDLSTLTDIAAGGAPRPVAHVKRLQESFTGAQPALGYGLTETNAVGCGNFWSNYADKPGSTGRAQAPLVEVGILDDAGQVLPTGERGEVAIRSAANVRGYWKDEAATRAAFTADGWFRSGDIGYLDDDGYLFIVDRKKDIIIRGGENISSQEVEAAIYANSAVSEAAVFGIADERLGEVPVAVVYSEAGGVDEAGLKAFLETRLAKFKVPARVHVVDAPLPRLGTGKIDRLSLKERYS
ncbi:class I adenylate-forming enzyme family protein [Allosphingosinicella indica]|uniref:Acyl-CoA synthetase (AMP-forming)/AMP-acid ligase II n=1 Tax=Allosphingosinicella indica TaxID=941907 RepID=A0A1X7G939_9SPHN|nr:class I adenylate-forming enzyme family protein [Allosphingosinicella indica]SMF65388.1 Acyl-CoA synthetase (AMP-forming)/AMP-acid ligase II [Allosphingosinicella indica]